MYSYLIIRSRRKGCILYRTGHLPQVLQGYCEYKKMIVDLKYSLDFEFSSFPFSISIV